MHFVVVNLPSWFEVGAAVALAFLTYRTLIVLREYAADTKTIAKASAWQTENAQKPFLVLLPKPQELGRHGGGWALENQGFGPAINIRHSDVGGADAFRENVRALAAGDFLIFHQFAYDVMIQRVFTAEYESLSGAKYRTVVVWQDGVMRTTFAKID